MKITPEKKQELRKKWNKLTEGATKCISFSPVSVLGKKYCGICGNNPEEVADYWLNVLEEETENQKKGMVERIESNNSGY